MVSTKITYSPDQVNSNIKVVFHLNQPTIIFSKTLTGKKRALIIIDSNLDKGKINLVKKLVGKYIDKLKLVKLHLQDKDLPSLEKIWRKMIALHPDVAIALGGGTTCDLVGLAASCYHRGLDHIFFPTTLLGMVDACIGGKTGIDFGGVKNSIGQMHYAKESYCILPFLTTLNKPELMSGVSEIIKAAILFDPQLFSQLKLIKADFDITPEWLEIISRSAKLKAQISEKPFSERARLLYGHNIGHGIETYNNVHRRHGDCVSIGMNYELALAMLAGIVNPSLWTRQNKLIKKFKLPSGLSGINFATLKQKMQLYKLYSNGNYFFVIPKNIGAIYESGNSYYWQVTEAQLDSLFSQLLQKVKL